MSTDQEIRKINSELAQYFNENFDYSNDDRTEQSILLKYNINYKILVRKYSESQYPELIGCTALHLAVKHNKVCDIDFLLSHGANPMIKNQNGFTPLHFAIDSNCEEIDAFHKVKLVCKSLLSAQVKLENLENPSDKNGLSHFHVACMANHAEAAEYFLQSGGISVDQAVNMDSSHFSGYTPLHLAVKYSALQVIELLLKFGANTQWKNAEGMTFLSMLLKIRTDIIKPQSRYKPYLSDPNLEIMNFLLQNDNYIIDYKGLTHFHIACSGTELSIAERFMQHVKDINHAVDLDATHWPGYTALHFAAYSSMEMVKMLVKNGGNMLTEDANGVAPLDMCLKKYEVGDIHDVLSLDATWTSILMSDRKTRLLSLIFAMKDTKRFDNFLELKAQIVNDCVPLDSPVWQGFTPLHIAIMFYEDDWIRYWKTKRHTDERSEHIVKKLVTNGANLNTQDIRGRSPIHLGFWRGIPTSSIKLLLVLNENIENAIDDNNLSHLHVACKTGHSESVKKILQNDVDVNLASKRPLDICNRKGIGTTPLHCAASNNEITKLLLLHGANPLLKDANGMTAIHHGTDDSFSDILLSLPNLKDSVVNELGLSHLHVAIYYNHVTATKKLLDIGAVVNQALLKEDVFSAACNEVGEIPLDLALKYGDTQMLELLLRRGADILVRETDLPTQRTSDALKPIVSSLDGDDILFKRLEKDIGLTMLHVACSRKEINLIKTLLASGANVNAQMNIRSRLWSGYTALHVVMDDKLDENVDEIVELLLDNSADITLADFEQKTALHLAYEMTCLKPSSNRYSSMRMILKAHKDFTVNPARLNGLSHFHIACIIGDINSVRRYLNDGADVNQLIDFFMKIQYFRERYMEAGFTPLHFAAASSECEMDATSQLKLIDLLLNSGADVNAEDAYGNTALHLMARWNYKREDVIFRLVKSKINLDCKYIQNKNPLEILLTANKGIVVGNINCFLKAGCPFNDFTSTHEGLIAIALEQICAEDLVNLLKSVIINLSNLVQKDIMGRTIIHNIVSYIKIHFKPPLPITDSQYAMLFKELDEFDFNIDAQDTLGRTPLHLAVLFRNTAAISGLLMTGADVNLIDTNGKTAFFYIFESCTRCARNINYKCRGDHTGIIFAFVIHLKKLLLCGLDVNQINEKLLFETLEKYKSEDMKVSELFQEKINEIRSLKIGKSKLTLGNFLRETDAVVAYATLPETDRNAVDEFFKDKINDLRTKYGQVASILLLQYRKAVNRLELIDPALSALNALARLSLPDLCSTAILKLLTNSELSSMIEATT